MSAVASTVASQREGGGFLFNLGWMGGWREAVVDDLTVKTVQENGNVTWKLLLMSQDRITSLLIQDVCLPAKHTV